VNGQGTLPFCACSVDVLLKFKFTLFFCDRSNGYTPLHRAMRGYREEAEVSIMNDVVELIQRGADLKLKDKDQCSV